MSAVAMPVATCLLAAAVVAAVGALDPPLRSTGRATRGRPASAAPWRASRRRRAVLAGVPAWLDAVSAELRAGGSLAGAVVRSIDEAPPPLGDDLAPVAAAVRRGVAVRRALVGQPAGAVSSDLRPALAALDLALEVGGPAAHAVDEVAAAARAALARRADARALAAPARLSVAVVGVVPVAFLALATVTDPGTARLLVATTPGRVALVVAAALDVVGVGWMVHLVRRAGR